MLYTALAQKNALPQAPEGVEEPLFADVEGTWAADYIHQAVRLGLVAGSDENIFAPDRPITRQEMMTIIDRCLDLPDENGLALPMTATLPSGPWKPPPAPPPPGCSRAAAAML